MEWSPSGLQQRWGAYLEDPKVAWRVPAALALGCMIGLIPRDSALGYLLLGLALLLPLSLRWVLAAGLLGWLISPFLDPVSDPLGYWLLTLGPLEPLWTALEGQWISAWLRLHNSVVLGNLVLGLALAWPIFQASRWVLQRTRTGIQRKNLTSPTLPPLATELDG